MTDLLIDRGADPSGGERFAEASPEMLDVFHAVQVAAKSTAAGTPSAVKCADLALASVVQNIFDAVKYDRMTAFEATQEHRVEGHASPVGWLKSHGHHEGRDAACWRRNSRFAKHLPLASAALARGEITATHLEHLHKAQQMVGEDVFAYVEELLVDAAVEQRFSDFTRTLEYFLVRVRPRTKKSKEDEDQEDKYCSSSRILGGNGRVDAQLPPLEFTIFDSELRRLYDDLRDQDRADARERLGRRPLDSELGRTARQRRAAALVLMAERSAAFDGEELPASRITLVVHADAELVAKLIQFVRDELADDDPDHEPDLGSIEYGGESLHELDDGTVVTVNTVLLALLTGVVRGCLFDADGEILRFGRERRIYPRPVQQAARARLRRCCHPYGCDRSAPFTQTDHRHEWSDGGPTDIDNADVLCPGHNLWKTNTKHDPPPAAPDTGQRRRPPDTGPLPR